MQNTPQKNLTELEKFNWIRLIRSENIGSATFFRLIKIFGSASEAIEKTPEFSLQGGAKKKLKICSKGDVENEILKTQKFGAEIIIFLEDDYPRLLREIYDPPATLTIFGKKELLNKDSIAIVGPRNASFHACKFAEKMAFDLGQEQVVVVSGLAKGVDASSHRGAIDSGTVAVIAGGVDNIYPLENADLFKQVKEKGVIVAEQPFGFAPRGSSFIQRNRIISGMSYGVVVIEAGMQSGSLATARFSLNQGREVFAVPGFPTDPRNFGSNALLEQGAIFTQNAERILREIPDFRARFSEAGILKEPDEFEFEEYEIKIPSDADISKVREEILQKIGFLPMSIEEIINEVGAAARLVNIALVQLELADKISIDFGRVVKK